MVSSGDDISFIHLFVPLTTRKAILFLCIVGIIMFFMSLFNGFIGDDNTQIIDNTAIHSLHSIPRFFLANRLTTSQHVSLGGLYYKPLLDVSYTLIYAVFGPSAFFYHLIQLILFITNACLVFLLFRHFFHQTTALLLSLLFLIHPITSETALYIADLQDVLFFFFGMIGLLLIIRYPSRKAIWAAGLCLLLAMLSKETGVLFIFVYLLYSGFFQKKLFLSTVIATVITSLLYAALRIHAVGIFHTSLANAPIERLSFSERLINIPSMVLFYLKTFFFPYTIASSWQWVYTTVSLAHFWMPLCIDLVFLVFITFLFVLIARKQSRLFVFCSLFFLLWFSLGLVFHMQIFPLDQTVADRWFYFPIVGLFGYLGVVLKIYFKDASNTRFASLVIIIFLMLSLRTLIRTFDFANDFTAASHDAAAPTNSYNAEFILSHIYYQEGQLQEAKQHAEKSVQMFPYITNYTNLGAVESSMGDYKNAKTAYLHALQYGDDALPYENLAALSLVYGNAQQDISFLQKNALKKYPEDWKIWFYYAILEYLHGDKHLALHAIQQAKKYAQIPYGANLLFVEYIITHSKQLILSTTNGAVRFSTQ